MKIGFFTSIRSEYGPMRSVLKAINADPFFELKLIVGGAHLRKEYGYSITSIIDDGFEVIAKLDFLADENSPEFLSQTMSKLSKEFGRILNEFSFDIILFCGDRFELLPVASCCLVHNIPMAHVSGGDVTEGAIDNQVRNALTKMANLHFPGTTVYKENILKMGEEEWRICACGEPGLDEILQTKILDKGEFCSKLGLSDAVPIFLVTFHPETINNSITPDFIEEIIKKILEKYTCQILITAANFDFGGYEINQRIERLSEINPFIFFKRNLGQQMFYSALNHSSLLLGNSSSGIIEAQSFNIPVVNVGERQKGRLTNPNVLTVKADTDSILEILDFALSANFKKSFQNKANVYGDGKSAQRIIAFLKNVDLTKLLPKKSVF